MDKILKGLPVSRKIYARIKEQIAREKLNPKLVIIFVGNDPAADYYVKMLEKKSKKIGILAETIKLGSAVTQTDFLQILSKLNNDEAVNGIMIQKPLPAQIDETMINNFINPQKDVDAFHPLNLGKMLLNEDAFIPCTPAAVLEMLKFYEITTNGKNVVILGRSNVVGKPLANLLLRKDETGNATVTICHSRTKNLKKITQNADILIAAIGRPEFVSQEMINEGVIIIDVGVNQIVTDKDTTAYVGDVNYDDCLNKSSFITPVPGVVGTVTTAKLLQNVVKAVEFQKM